MKTPQKSRLFFRYMTTLSICERWPSTPKIKQQSSITNVSGGKKIPPLVGLVPPWDQMLQNVTVEKSRCSCRPRRTPAGAARLALQPQQLRYLGEFAETAETPSIRLELPITAITLQAAASTQFPPAAAIPAHSTIQCPPRGTHHIQAASPLAQASVRSPFTLRKERTRNLQVPMGLAASTTTRLSSGSR